MYVCGGDETGSERSITQKGFSCEGKQYGSMCCLAVHEGELQYVPRHASFLCCVFGFVIGGCVFLL